MAAISALTGLAGSLGLMGGGLAANRLNQGSLFHLLKML